MVQTKQQTSLGMLLNRTSFLALKTLQANTKEHGMLRKTISLLLNYLLSTISLVTVHW